MATTNAPKETSVDAEAIRAEGLNRLVPRLAKSDELPLRATYHGSNVYDGCHASFDKLNLGQHAAFSGQRDRMTIL